MRLDEWLTIKGMTQKQFGDMLDPPLPQSHLSNYIHGRVAISLARAVEIEGVTGGAVKCAEWLSRPAK